jgi:hypothetical protein
MTKKAHARWGYVFYEERDNAPAYEWLAALPSNIRGEFLNTLESVLLSSNPPTQYLLNRWHAMKKVGSIDMGGYHEARDQHANTNYRLYCRFDRAAAEVDELGAPVLVILHGASKREETAMPDSVYREVQRCWDRYFQPKRRCSEVEFPPLELDPQSLKG